MTRRRLAVARLERSWRVLHTFWSVKGGSGVTVTAALYAAALARRHGTATVVDLCGDQPAALGMVEPHGAGWRDWCAAPDGSAEALERLLLPVDDHLTLLPVGTSSNRPVERPAALVAALGSLGHVVVDAGVVDPSAVRSGDPGGAGLVPVDRAGRDELFAALAQEGRTTLVLRPCYLALRRAVQVTAHVEDVVVLHEAGRALGADDVRRLLGTRVLAVIDVDPAIARSVDAGVLPRRRHTGIARALEASA